MFEKILKFSNLRLKISKIFFIKLPIQTKMFTSTELPAKNSILQPSNSSSFLPFLNLKCMNSLLIFSFYIAIFYFIKLFHFHHKMQFIESMRISFIYIPTCILSLVYPTTISIHEGFFWELFKYKYNFLERFFIFI